MLVRNITRLKIYWLSMEEHVHVKEEDQPMIDKEIQRLVYLDILKQDISSYSSHIMLIARRNLNLIVHYP